MSKVLTKVGNKVFKASLENPYERLFVKIQRRLSEFICNGAPSKIDDVIEDYALIAKPKKDLEKMYNALRDVFKEGGKQTYKGRRYTIVKKTSTAMTFDKEAFIAEYGKGTYEKFTRASERVEFIIIEPTVE